MHGRKGARAHRHDTSMHTHTHARARATQTHTHKLTQNIVINYIVLYNSILIKTTVDEIILGRGIRIFLPPECPTLIWGPPSLLLNGNRGNILRN